MKRKKNGFFTFIWSFIPGAAEMYMGFMRCGLSLMTLFLASIMLPAMLRVSDALFLVSVLVWFYSFFHARNLASCTEEMLRSMTDDFIWDSFEDGRKIRIASSTVQKWVAVILIVVGASMLWNHFRSIVVNLIPGKYWDMIWPIFDNVPEIAISLLIIAVGIGLIIGKKREVNDEQ